MLYYILHSSRLTLVKDMTELHVHTRGHECRALASLLGTVPELVSRKLGEFYRQGWIRLERRRVWIMRPDLLENLF